MLPSGVHDRYSKFLAGMLCSKISSDVVTADKSHID